MASPWALAWSSPGISVHGIRSICAAPFIPRLFFGIVAGLALTVLGILLTPQLLRWMGTPELRYCRQSITYFRVYFAGALAVVLYNVAVGILQAIGDSKHPLYYLMISSGVNVVLDLLFVAVMGFGVGAVRGVGHYHCPEPQCGAGLLSAHPPRHGISDLLAAD